MNKLLLILSFVFGSEIVAVSVDDLIQKEWKAFKLAHKKQYENEEEEQMRLNIFAENADNIAKHNQNYELGLVSYKLQINKFSDLLHDEFSKMVNGFITPSGSLNGELKGKGEARVATFIPPANFVCPDSIDWREYGGVTPVKNQGNCGSCWSFSATGALEGQHFRKYGKLVSLSEQNLIDCTKDNGNFGCDGGYVDKAFQYIYENHGIDTESSYAYEGKVGECRYDPKNKGADDYGYTDIEHGDEKRLMEAVATMGPVSVAINAKVTGFSSYKTGIFYHPECGELTDHAVLVVGYGTDNGMDYWIVKNSWGVDWGEDGYVRMARNRGNNCGIASYACYPIV